MHGGPHTDPPSKTWAEKAIGRAYTQKGPNAHKETFFFFSSLSLLHFSLHPWAPSPVAANHIYAQGTITMYANVPFDVVRIMQKPVKMWAVGKGHQLVGTNWD